MKNYIIFGKKFEKKVQEKKDCEIMNDKNCRCRILHDGKRGQNRDLNKKTQASKRSWVKY